jgi:hypothetical protein
MVADHLLKLDESNGDSVFQKKAVMDSAATATGGEHNTMRFVRLIKPSRKQLVLRR